MEAVDPVLAVLWQAARRRRRGVVVEPPTAEHVRSFLEDEVEGDQVDAALAALVTEGALVADGEGWWVADDHAARARAAYERTSAVSFGRWMVACEESAAYRTFCAQVNHLPFVVFDMLDPDQLDAALAAVGEGTGQRLLDLGCGVGTLTEQVAARTGAQVHGVDFAPAAIVRARERTADRPGLSFEVATLDALEPAAGSWDVILSFDTLYFAEDLDRLIRACARALRPGGRLITFFSALDAPAEALLPDGTRLARALQGAGLPYTTTEFTDAELALWRRSAEAVLALEALFEVEGSGRLWRSRQKETGGVLPLCEQGRSRRYLYVATLPTKRGTTNK